MGEEDKKQPQESEATEPRDLQPPEPEAEQPESEAAPEEQLKPAGDNGLGEKRGRMIASGLVVAVVGSLIAVAVAAIFQVTSIWLVKCPQDLTVNDPAPILWSDVVSEKAEAAPLGVPESLAKVSSLKGVPVQAK